MDKRFLSRKFILTVLIEVGATIFVLTGALDVDQWMQLSKWILGIYAVGNAGEHIAKSFRSKSDTNKNGVSKWQNYKS